MATLQQRKAHQSKVTLPKARTSGPDRRAPVAQMSPAERLVLRRAVADPGAAPPTGILALQRAYGNRAVTHLLQIADPTTAYGLSGSYIQRDLHEDAGTWAREWTASPRCCFVQLVNQYRFETLVEVCQQIISGDRDTKAKYTTALATAIFGLGEADAGVLYSAISKNGRTPKVQQILKHLNGLINQSSLGGALPAPPAAGRAASAVKEDPFMVIGVGSARFTFSRGKAVYMLERHHPHYINTPPRQIQSYFEAGATLDQIKGLVNQIACKAAEEVKNWRLARIKGKIPLGQTLDLHASIEGKAYELTLTLPEKNPQASAGSVAHFTPIVS